MNRAYKSIWSDRTQCFVAVSEATKGRGKRSSSCRSVLAASAFALGASLALPALAADSTYVAQPNDAQSNLIVATDGRLALYVPIASSAYFSNSHFSTSPSEFMNDYAVVLAESNSTLNLTASTVTTSGQETHGVRVVQFSAPSPSAVTRLEMASSTVSTTGVEGDALRFLSYSGAAIEGKISASKLTTTGERASGLFAYGEATRINAYDTEILTSGASAIGVQAQAWSSVYLNAGTSIDTTGANAIGAEASNGSTLQIEGRITTSGERAHGVSAIYGGHLLLNGASISTMGEMAHAVSVSGSDAEISATLATNGWDAFGLYADNRARVTLQSGTTIKTDKTNAHGIYARGEGTSVIGTANVSTAAAGALGAIAEDGGSISLTGSVSTIGDSSYGLVASSYGKVNSGSEIVTSGTGAVGALADLNGTLTLSSKSSIFTAGEGAHGVQASGGAVVKSSGMIETMGMAAAGVQVNDATVNLNGGIIATTGQDSHGVLAQRFDGRTSIVGTSIKSSGDNAHGVYASNATIDLVGAKIRTTGTFASFGSSFSNDASYGILASNLSAVTGSANVETSGGGSNAAVSSFGSTLQLKNSSLATKGDAAHGLVAFNATASLDDGTITTQKADAFGAVAYGIEHLYTRGVSAPAVSELALSGTRVTTQGMGSHGVVAGGEYLLHGVSVGTSAGNANLANVTVNTFGERANAARVAFGGALTSNATQFFTEGQQADGIWVDSGRATLTGGSVTTTGNWSNALWAQNGAEIVSTAAITTGGLTSRGAYAENATIALTGGSVTTTGDTGIGVVATGSKARVSSDIAIATSGAWAIGVVADQQATVVLSDTASIKTTGQGAGGISAGYGSTITGTVNISTEGESAYGVNVDDSEVSFTGGSIVTAGKSANALASYGNARGITLANVSIETTGAGSQGIYASRSLITLSNAKIATSGTTITYPWGYESDGGIGINATYLSTVSGDVSIQTSGAKAVAAQSTSSSKLDLVDSTLTTKGNAAHGLVASDALASLTRGEIVTAGAGAYGISASGSGNSGNPLGRGEVSLPSVTEVTATDVTIATSGVASHGVVAGAAPVVQENWTFARAPLPVSTDGPGTVNLNNSTVTVTGAESHAAQVGYGGALYAKNTTLTSEQGSGLSLIDGATVALSNTTVKAKNESMRSMLTKADANQNIVVGAGSTLTENNGVLLRVTRSAEGSGKVVLDLQDGSTSSGSIIDNLDGVTTTDATGTYVTVGNKAIFNGQVMGVKEFNTLVGTAGQNLTFTGGSQLATLNLVGDNAISHGGTIDNPIIATNDVNVSNAAVFGGNWRIGGTLNVSNGSFVRPGNSVGVVTVNQINWGVGTVYDAEINAAGQSDRIDVTGGGADLSKTALRVSQENGTGGYRLNYDYNVLTAAGAITPFLSTAYTGTEIVKLTPVYGANAVAVRLTVDEKKVEELPLTENQQEVVDKTLPTVTPPVDGTTPAVTNPAVDDAYQSPDPAKAFDQLSGEVHASTRSALIASASLLPNTISQRLRGNLDNGMAAGAPTASTAASTGSALPGSARPVWGQVVGNWQRLDGKNGSARLEQDLYGLYLGGDTLVRGGWRVGGVFGYTDGSVRVRDRQSRADVDSYSLGIYGGNSWKLGVGSLNAMVGAGYTWHDVDTRRNVSLGGGQELKAGYDASTAQVFGELGYAMPVNSRVTVEPYAGVAYLNQHTQGFRENGGSAALRGTSGNEDVTTTTLGLRSKTQVQVGPADVALQAGLGWRHAFGGLTPKAQLSLLEGGAGAFRVAGAPIAKDAAVVDLGAEVAVSRNTALGLSYSGQFGNGNRDNAGGLYLRVAF